MNTPVCDFEISFLYAFLPVKLTRFNVDRKQMQKGLNSFVCHIESLFVARYFSVISPTLLHPEQRTAFRRVVGIRFFSISFRYRQNMEKM